MFISHECRTCLTVSMETFSLYHCVNFINTLEYQSSCHNTQQVKLKLKIQNNNNNRLQEVASLFLSTVEEHKGIPPSVTQVSHFMTLFSLGSSNICKLTSDKHQEPQTLLLLFKESHYKQ